MPTIKRNHWYLALLALVASSQNGDIFAPHKLEDASQITVHNRPRPSVTLNYKIHDEATVNSSLISSDLISPKFVSKIKVPSTFPPTAEDVKLSFLPSRNSDSVDKHFPLVIEPEDDRSVHFLQSFLFHNKDWLDKQILQYGAILFRGFGIESAQDVEDTLLSYEKNLSADYRGTSPRNAQDGTKYVFSAAEVPSNYPIAQHLEMSFLESLPPKVFFSALQAPESTGGETALSDFAQVYNDISPALRNKLATKKIRYRRTHQKKGARFTHDVAAMTSWPEIFGTTDKKQVEAIAELENMPMTWEGKNHDVFVSEYEAEPFQLHPETQEPVWFNHAQVFHWTTFSAELWFSFIQTNDFRFLWHSILVGVQSVIQYGLLGYRMGLDISFGDGTPFSISEISEIRQAVHRNMVMNRWQKGDLVMIDNFRIAHGRQPTFDQGRRVVVAWSDAVGKSNKPVVVEQQQQQQTK